MRIVRTKRYVKDLKKIRAPAADIDVLERTLCVNPTVGVLIQGLKGVRKARFRIGSRGKSGGGRVIYYVMVSADVVAMLMAYAKSEKSDLSPEDRRSVLRALEEIDR